MKRKREDYNSELKVAIYILKNIKFKPKKEKELSPESATKATLLIIAKQVLKEFNQRYVPEREFDRIVNLCNRITSYWGGRKKYSSLD